MKKSKLLYVLLFLSIFTFVSCGSSSEEEIKEEVVEKDAELALLMRQMKADMLKIKQMVKDSVPVPDSIFANYAFIHEAIPTDPAVRGPVFEGFSNSYLASLKAFSESDTGKVYYFNQLINSCMECHYEYCPGPIPTINKLKIRSALKTE